MKRLLIIILMLVVVLTAFQACGEKKEPIDMVKDKVSLKETELYVADNDVFYFEARRIIGESAVTLDGEVGEVKDRVVIKLLPKNLDMMNEEYVISVTGDKGSRDVKVEKDIMGLSFSANVDDMSSVGSISEVVVKYQDKSSELTAENKMKDVKIDVDKAVELAYNELLSVIEGDFDKNEFLREVTVRYINNRKDPASSPHYWYVSMIKSKEDYYSVLIDPVSGNIVNKKTQ